HVWTIHARPGTQGTILIPTAVSPDPSEAGNPSPSMNRFFLMDARVKPGHDQRRTTAAGACLGPFWPNPLEPPLHRLVRNPRARPAVEPAVHEPDHQKAEYAGEHHVAEEMRAGCHAQHAHGGAEGERAAIGERAPLRRHHRGARHRPERARRLAGD